MFLYKAPTNNKKKERIYFCSLLIKQLKRQTDKQTEKPLLDEAFAVFLTADNMRRGGGTFRNETLMPKCEISACLSL